MSEKKIKYEKPILDILLLNVKDIVCLSTGQEEPDPDYEDVGELLTW